MNKLITLFLTLFFIGQPMMGHAAAAKEKRDDSRYLAGAVPVIDGKVVFSKEFQVPGKSQKDIYNTALGWMNKRLKANGNEQSRVVYTDESTYTIAGRGEEWIVFRSRPLWLDRTWVEYQITAVCQAGKCEIRLEKIRYTYQENLHYTAEEWITDEYAYNKEKNKLVRRYAKWRRKTVDFADALFYDAAVAFGMPDERVNVEEQEKKNEDATKVVRTAGPIVIGGGAQPIDRNGYRNVDLKQLPGELYQLIGNGKLVVAIGKDEFNMTSITANEGGAIGKQSGKTVAYCTLSAQQPHDAMDEADEYTLKVYAEGSTEPAFIIECKKIGAPDAKEGESRTYVGEILKVSEKAR